MRLSIVWLSSCVWLCCLVTPHCCQHAAPPPTDVTGTNTSAHGILVQWSPVLSNSINGTLIGYRVFYKENGSSSSERATHVGADTTKLEITGLDPYKLYRVQVAANTSVGTGQRSDVILVRTDEAHPSEIPKITLSESREPTTIYLEWDPISPDKVNGVLKGYRVYYLKSIDIHDYMNKYRKVIVGPLQQNATLTGLLPYTEYLVGVAAYNSKGVDLTPGTLQHVKRVWTSQAAPSPPDELTAKFTSDTILRADWLPISRDNVNGILLGYEYQLHMNGSRLIRNGTLLNTTTSHTFTSLETCASYVVSVRGWTAGGYGNYSTLRLPYRCGIPSIEDPEINVIATVSQPVVLPLNYTSIPAATSIVWKFGKHQLARNEEMHQFAVNTETNKMVKTVIRNNETLYISLLSHDDVGKYTCTVTNRFGSAVATRTLLTREDTIQLSFSLKLKDEEFIEELKDQKTQQFSNLADRLKQAVQQLYSDKKTYSLLDIKVFSFSNGSVVASFEILAKLKNGTGDMSKRKVEATHDILGTMVTNARSGYISGLSVDDLIIQGKPPAVQNLQAIDIHPTFVKISWKVPDYRKEYRVSGYSLQYRKHGQSYVTVESVGEAVKSGVMKGLESNTNYYIRVVSHRKSKTGESKELEINTEDRMVKEALLIIGLPVAIAVLFVIVILIVFRPRCSTAEEEELAMAGDTRLFGPPAENLYDITRYLEEFPCEWTEIPRDDVKFGKELGAGAFGQVMAGTISKDGRNISCAIKMLKRHATERDYRDLFNELSIMAQIGNHSNVVSLIGACTTDGPLWVIVSLAENGCMLDYLHRHRRPDYTDHSYQNVRGNDSSYEPKGIEKPQKLKFAHGIARGMRHLEKHKCVHRDMAARNVLLGRNLVPMVSDFGLSRDIYECGLYEDLRGGKRPVRWMSPESLEDYTCTLKSDVWSYGIVLWEIETAGTVPYPGIENGLEILNKLKRGYRLEQPPGCDDKIYDLMLDTWEANPLNRPSFEVIVERVEVLLTDISGYLEIQPYEPEPTHLAPYDEVNITASQLDIANGNVQPGGSHDNLHQPDDDIHGNQRVNENVENDTSASDSEHAQVTGESHDTSRDTNDPSRDTQDTSSDIPKSTEEDTRC